MQFISRLFVIAILFGIASLSLAQKVGYIASENILGRLPEARDAQGKLENEIDEWKTAVTEMEIALRSKQGEYEKRRLVLSGAERKRSEESIDSLKNAIGNYRTQKFGEAGDLSVRQDELMKPIFEKIQKAVSAVAEEAGYDYIFDKSSPGLYLLYTVPKYDLTSRVGTKLGLTEEKAGEKKKDPKANEMKSDSAKIKSPVPSRSPTRQVPRPGPGGPMIDMNPFESPKEATP